MFVSPFNGAEGSDGPAPSVFSMAEWTSQSEARRQAAKTIIGDWVAGRSYDSDTTGQHIEIDHPELQPELADELHKARMVLRARDEAHRRKMSGLENG